MKFSFRSSQILALVMAICLVMAHVGDADAKQRKRSSRKQQTVSRALGVNDARYAAVIMSPVTGEVYHQKDADELRYPASLTKMMTLYMLFEALESGKVTLDTDMSVSALAARQPQTNLSLDEGDRIEVETAIKALVVRSANDVSVVVAEALAGDVDSFAKRMTSKARALGMQNTTFKNPNGLPNAGQRTTARDMAKLGIALKRDFPRYYRYFSTLQFSHNGVTYYTHNRVMLRYAGVDGIKTGYIGVSGFNLVTSVMRGGRPVVGVVMGGSSGRWRDDRMIELLDNAYGVIASRGAARGKLYPNNLPTPKPGSKQPAGLSEPQSEAAAPVVPSTISDVAVSENAEGEDGGVVDNAMPSELPAPVETAPAQEPESTIQVTPQPQAAPAQFQPKVIAPSHSRVITVTPAKPLATSPFALANPPETMTMEPKSVPAPVSLANPPAAKGDYDWGIQVGAFSSQALAEQAVRAAEQTAARQLIGAKPSVMGPSGTGTPVYRARLENISQTQARRACEALIAHNAPCFIYKAP